MAIQYIGTTISGVSGDTKPTLTANEKGVVFVETDTNKIYQWDTDSWNIITAADATTSAKGVASFNSDNFAVSSGVVTIKDGGVILGTETTGNYAATIAGTANQIAASASTGAITLSIPNNPTLPGNVIVSGNLTVSGSTTTVNTATLTVEDPLVSLATGNNTSDAVDIGIYGLYDTSGSQDLYGGLFRDASDGKWRLFKDNQAAPTTTVNTSGTGYAVGTLVANLEGTVTGSVTGNAGTVTNGVYTSGTQTVGGAKTFSSLLTASSGISSTGGSYFGVNGTGVDVTFYGTTTDRYIKWDGASGNNLRFSDNAKAYFGQPGNDLQIFHNGSNSYITDAGDGAIIVKTNTFTLRNAADDEQMIYAGENGSVDLYYDSVKKFETSSTGVTVSGDLTSTGNLKVAANGYVWFGDVNHIIDVDAGSMNFKMPADEHFIWQEGGNSIMKLEGTNRRLGIGLNASPDHTLLVYNESLGGTAGNETNIARLGSSSANADSVVFTGRRDANGSDWTTARLKIQRRVDVTDMGYVGFGHPDSGTVLFGNGDTDYFKMLMPASGEKSFTISSYTTGDAVLYIEADTDNSYESDNPKIVMKQDGGAVVHTIGVLGNADDVASGTIANSMYFNTGHNDRDFHWIAGTEEIMHLDTSSANLMIGRNDAKAGMMQIFGAGSGSSVGAAIQFFTAADHDSTYPYYDIKAYDDDLRFGRMGQVDFKIEAEGKVRSLNDLVIDGNGKFLLLKGGVTGTKSGIAWTFNADTNTNHYAEMQIDYDTRASLGLHINVGYPITLDATTQINFDLAGSRKMTMTSTGLNITGVAQVGPNSSGLTSYQLEIANAGNGNQARITSTNNHAALVIHAGSDSVHSFIRHTTTGSNSWEAGMDASNRYYINPNIASGTSGSAMVLHNNGNVGIGNITDSGFKLDIYSGSTRYVRAGHASSHELYVYRNTASASAAAFRVNVDHASDGQAAIYIDQDGAGTFITGDAGGSVMFALNANGTIRLSGGSPADGKVLTATDSSGNAVWEEASGGGGAGVAIAMAMIFGGS